MYTCSFSLLSLLWSCIMHFLGVWFLACVGGRLVNTSARVMPGETFGCAAHFFSPNAQLDGVFAMHMFR
jgi:hypothetical protein